MLKRCEDTNLVLNWEKSHFMVKEGIVLGHKISKSGIEVDRAKVEVIAKLPHPTTVKVSLVLKRMQRGKINSVDPFAPKFDVESETKKEAETSSQLIKLSRLKNPQQNEFENKEITKTFPLETLGSVALHDDNAPWYADFANYHAGNFIVNEKTKSNHDAKIKNRVFNVGDQVLLFNSRLKIFSGKLKSRWSGPFTVTQVFPYGTVELSQNSGPNFKVNGHRLKHYFGGDIPTEDFPDCEDSRARSFVLHSQEFHILSFILGIQYPNLID
ncbi:hypothetical protein Tco_1193977 [Tanacetum coccineum]